ncbi:BPTD_3080 family restriction endonuclease [Sphingobium yanoikuyae]|uniref:DEAD/DEAH box helicase family protein n=1 Tax=Sphingobium yanoikuyae TaxID=13690 RepID=A0A9X7UBF5_SPHYA|nr:DEAD/DEAH box helicase family protein [Sphingobium yanoikuyae]QNG44212.1 DEAD/DEAH box helicase family protein [Sphingobium yanoikuyae]
MANSFYERPILNSPYAPPSLYHPLDDTGQPIEGAPIDGRRPSKFIVPVPASRKKAAAAQASLDLETYTENAKINEIRRYVDTWRAIPNPADWGVTPTTQRLLEHWRRPKDEWAGPRPFFCQIEAVETMIWLTEVAPRRAATRGLLDQIAKDNEEANPALFRLAMKMATGSGKTTVMAMLIAWQAINAARKETKDFSRAFLIVAPGITIKDRLRVLQPSEPGNYYDSREIVPPEMLPEIRRAEIVITNYHTFQHRETLAMPKAARSFLQGNDPEPIRTIETDAQMLERACEKLLRFERVNVINDEAHHCYRHKVGGDAEGALTGDEKKEAEQNEEAARLWINGIEALDRQLKKGKRSGGVRAVYDLSATPFFLRGSGYQEGTLFPWVVSDFSLMDAIESGIVKLPRVPVTDNLVQTDTVVYRDLWKHIGKSMPKSTASANKLSPFDLNPLLLTALNSLYSHYQGEFERWQKAGIGVPPVFIVVCQNTAISKLVFEWIAGFERGDADAGERAAFHAGHLELFRNYDEHGGRLPRPRTLLIDSRQLEAGEALDKGFKEAASVEIEQFKRELAAREGAGAVKGDINESDLLREVMNTVGRPGRLGEQIRCVVSVSMLTEGWDTNTVTHILGVRAFGTQLLCEQVVGRGLRRQSYELNKEGLFDVEYADIMGIPFDFARSPQKVDAKPPKPVTRVHAIAERADLEIRFPRVSGYRRELPSERLNAQFDEDSRLVITPEDIGPTSVTMEGIVGAGVTITPEVLSQLRPSEISFNLAKHLLYTHFRDEDGFPKQHLFPQIQRLARRWIDEGYLVTKGVPIGAILYQEQLARAAEKIDIACTRGGGGHVVAVLDPYNPNGSTRHVNFITSKDCWKTGAQPPRSQISHVVKDSSWEVALAQALEGHDRVLAYAKNQALGFEIPYLDGGAMRRYLPDFLVRLDTGAEPLNLVLEMKGQRDESDKAKAQTARELWVPGVNALGGYGRWAFAEFTDPYTTEDEFKTLVTKLIDGAAA